MDIITVIWRVLIFILGLMLVYITLGSALRTFVLPRSENVFLTRLVFTTLYKLFQIRLRWTNSYAQRDRVLAYFAPLALLMMPIAATCNLLLMGYLPN